jgi:uncharacterized protein (DUF58 family)
MARLRLPRRFPPTREGWWFLVATLLVGAAAVNGGVNLLFFVFGMMLFLILASGILSELCLRNLVVTRRPPATIHANTPYLMGMAVRNEKRWVSTFSLEVEDLVEGRPVDRRCYYLKLPARRVQETAYRNVLARRGYHRLTGFRISTRFPFGLIRKSRDLEAPMQLLVYPALVPVPESLLPGGAAEAGPRQSQSPSRRGDFYGLREFRLGDDPRDIHWRVSARRGRPFVRESEDESSRTVVVVLEERRDGHEDHRATGSAGVGGGGQQADPRGDQEGPDPASTPQGPPAFEAAVSLAASVVLHLLKKGYLVGLAAGGGYVPPTRSPGQATQLLRMLALVEPGRSGALPPAARGLTRVNVRPTTGAPALETVVAAAHRRSA